jgi:hypothetical protein
MHADRLKADSEGIPQGEDQGQEREDAHEEHDIDAQHGGFSGSCETTLIDWIQLVQMGRRDAVVSVRTYDGREGTLWCRDGDIIDADCDGALGEDAVFRALSWKGGRVSVDFGAVKKQRQIATATAGLLLRAAYRRDSGIHELKDFVDPADRGDVQGTFDFGSDTTEVVEASLFFARPMSDHESPHEAVLSARASRHPLSLRFAVAGGLSVLLAFSVLAWKWIYPAQPTSAVAAIPAAASGLARAVPPAPEPPEAPREATPSAVAARISTPAPVPTMRKSTPAASAASNGALARHRAAAMVLARRSAATSSSGIGARLSDSARTSTPTSSRVRVEVIKSAAEPRQPRVQIIEEARERPQPRIQIIDDHKPRIEAVE